MQLYIILLCILIWYILFWIYLHLLRSKIHKLETRIMLLFKEKTDLIPSLFEVSKWHLTKHEDIFHEIIKLRKLNFSEQNTHVKLFNIIKTQELLHNELNFIFQICNKHEKLLKEGNFIYLRDLIIDKSYHISQDIRLYKNIIEIHNNIIHWKNIILVGIIIPFGKIRTI